MLGKSFDWSTDGNFKRSPSRGCRPFIRTLIGHHSTLFKMLNSDWQPRKIMSASLPQKSFPHFTHRQAELNVVVLWCQIASGRSAPLLMLSFDPFVCHSRPDFCGAESGLFVVIKHDTAPKTRYSVQKATN